LPVFFDKTTMLAVTALVLPFRFPFSVSGETEGLTFSVTQHIPDCARMPF